MDATILRAQYIRTAIRLEIFTVGYMVLEALAALVIGFLTHSASLETFGLDSLIEIASGLVLLWRLNAEGKSHGPDSVERVEQRAARFAGVSLWVLAVYVVLQSLYSLWTRAEAEPSVWGIGLALLSLGVMPWLGRLKLRAADRISSRALHADAFETMACAYLSLTLLLGLTANFFFQWWWADPVAALVMVYFIVREAREALAGEHENDEEPAAG